MREELYRKLKARLEALCVNAAGEYYERPDDADMDDELYPRAIKHIDLWSHNVEFLEQEAYGRGRRCSSNLCLSSGTQSCRVSNTGRSR